MENQFPSFPYLIAFLLFILTVLKTWKRSKSITHSSPNLAPGPWKLPIIGNLHQLLGSLPHRRLRDLSKKYGPLMHLQFGEVLVIVVSSPEEAKEVMKTHDRLLSDRPFSLAASTIFYGPRDIAFLPCGDQWRQLRKICTAELLSATRVGSYQLVREEEVSAVVRSIASSAASPVNLSRILNSLTNSITARAAFGNNLCKEKDAFLELVKTLMVVLSGFSIADFFPSVKSLHVISGMKRKLVKLHKEIDVILEDIINDRRGLGSATAGSPGESAETLVDLLLNLQDHENLEFPLATDDIKAVILEMFVAGTVTSSTTVEWAMAELLKNPILMEKAQTELRQLFSTMGHVDETRLHELKYFNSIIKESLRLHPPAPLLIPRQARERVEINGYDIPAKTTIIVNAWAIGRDPNHWSDAETFCPERLLDSSIDYKGIDFQLIPFGAGRRMCPGMSFGVAMVELTLANLLYHFDWKLPQGTLPENLDMSEAFGIEGKRKNELFTVPTRYDRPLQPLC